MQSLTKLFANLFPSSTHSILDESHPRNVGKLKPDRHSNDPDLAWDRMKKKQNVHSVKDVNGVDTPVPDDRVRFVCIADTHTKLEQSHVHIPDGDVLLHAGDMTMSGQREELEIVRKYLASLPHKHKIVIAGNHDMSFDQKYMDKKKRNFYYTFDHQDFQKYLQQCGARDTRDLLTDCIYLEDSMVKIYGINIYGSPWTAGSGCWGFQCSRGSQLMSRWNLIPDSTDILLTHMPPLGYGDNLQENFNGKLNLRKFFACQEHVGCVDLLKTVQMRVKPMYHVYGHIHEGYGIRTDGTTTFVNAAICDEHYSPVNAPVIFDVQLPRGITKQSFGDNAVEWVLRTATCDLFEADDFEIGFDDNIEITEEEAATGCVLQKDSETTLMGNDSSSSLQDDTYSDESCEMDERVQDGTDSGSHDSQSAEEGGRRIKPVGICDNDVSAENTVEPSKQDCLDIGSELNCSYEETVGRHSNAEVEIGTQ